MSRTSKSTIVWNKVLNFFAVLIYNGIKLHRKGLGDDWHAVILETSVEVDYVLDTHVAPCGVYYIGGSTNSNKNFYQLLSMNNDYSYYIPNNSGINKAH